jgi:SAM-dependent methyltransferase
MKRANSFYVHGTTPVEQQRLTRLNQLINAASLKELRLEGGEKILDVGSGLGQLTWALAGAAGPHGSVLGIERSLEQIAVSQLAANLEFRQGDALELPLASHEWGTFDLAHTRFLLEHVSDPVAVVRGMARAIRPGGRAVLEDDDHGVLRLWPEPTGFPELWTAYVETYRRAGNDPYVGRRLVSLLAEAGLRPSRNTWLFFGSCAGSQDFTGYVENLVRILEGAQPHILQAGFSADRFGPAIAAIEEWGRRPDSALWYSICWAEAVKPAA